MRDSGSGVGQIARRPDGNKYKKNKLSPGLIRWR